MPHPWVVSDGTIITPAGTQVYLGITTRAKAVALNPTGNHTAAVLQMGAPQAAIIFNTQTGAVLQKLQQRHTETTGSATSASPIRRMASTCCSARTAASLPIVNVDSATGHVTSDVARISVPLDATIVNFPAFGVSEPVLNTANCTQTVTMPGTDGYDFRPCGNLGQLCDPLRRSHLRYQFLSTGPRGLAG